MRAGWWTSTSTGTTRTCPPPALLAFRSFCRFVFVLWRLTHTSRPPPSPSVTCERAPLRSFSTPWYTHPSLLAFPHRDRSRARGAFLSLVLAAQIAPLFDGSKDFAEEKKAAILDLETSLQIIDARLANTQFIAGAWHYLLCAMVCAVVCAVCAVARLVRIKVLRAMNNACRG